VKEFYVRATQMLYTDEKSTEPGEIKEVWKRRRTGKSNGWMKGRCYYSAWRLPFNLSDLEGLTRSIKLQPA